MRTQWPSGFHRTDLRARFIIWTPKSAALTRCRSRISPLARVTPSAELELTRCERIRYTNKFDAPNLPGEMQTTITLKLVFCGTELNITQEGIPAAILPEACYLGWQESLMLLANLVEAEIPDQP